ncbi:Rhs family protein [Acinetobacter gerneri DSM 14967 = CIP 107464 = MTCC 9824]|nr:RHS domain-containing protein [Acinetobacter gerneri]EPR84378.1 Rhs family protein [Acinetobacter gerneri DSM 14967 = CIP 107464 = MTCC 9824]
MWHTAQKAEKLDRVWYYDHLGTLQEMSDQSGAIVWTAEYKAWVSKEKQNTALPETQDEYYTQIKN